MLSSVLNRYDPDPKFRTPDNQTRGLPQMPVYIFASVRGKDFEIEGNDPFDAYRSLQHREKDKGTLWRLVDEYRNRHAVLHEGFEPLIGVDLDQTPVYKLRSEE